MIILQSQKARTFPLLFDHCKTTLPQTPSLFAKRKVQQKPCLALSLSFIKVRDNFSHRRVLLVTQLPNTSFLNMFTNYKKVAGLLSPGFYDISQRMSRSNGCCRLLKRFVSDNYVFFFTAPLLPLKIVGQRVNDDKAHPRNHICHLRNHEYPLFAPNPSVTADTR